jgi:hypothetical protein
VGNDDIEFIVVVAAELTALNIEFAAAGTVCVAKSDTDVRADDAAAGTVCVAKSDTELRAEFVAFVALVPIL